MSRTLRGGRTIDAGVGCRSHRSATLDLRASMRTNSADSMGKTVFSVPCCLPQSRCDIFSRRCVSLSTMFSYVVAIALAARLRAQENWSR